MFGCHPLNVRHATMVSRHLLLLYVFCTTACRGFFFSSNITCYCNNESMLGDKHRLCVQNRCTSDKSLVECYVQRVEPDKVEYGCSITPICRAYHEHEVRLGQKFIHCCRSHMCNEQFNGTDLVHYDSKRTTTAGHGTAVAKHGSSVLPEGMIILIVIVPLSLLVVTVFAVWKQFRKTNMTCTSALLGIAETGEFRGEARLTDMSSGTGSGCQQMVQQTISAQVTLKQCLSKGTFGSLVYRGVWLGTDVCVKVYFEGQKELWLREYNIYQTFLLRHENVLGFIASDSRQCATLTEYWMVYDHHPSGSLYDIMQTEHFTWSRALNIIYGIVCGLNHLHLEVVGSSRRKPAIAHRSLNTQHILMKTDYTPCLGGLSTAATRTNILTEGVYMPPSTTRTRYHAPELLNDTINVAHFDAHLKTDTYALGLCLWEVCWRTHLVGTVEPYAPPFHEHLLTNNPSHEELLRVVCVNNERPTFPDHWMKVRGMETLLKVMSECWVDDASARLPTLRVKKNIGALLTQNNIDISSSASSSTST